MKERFERRRTLKASKYVQIFLSIFTAIFQVGYLFSLKVKAAFTRTYNKGSHITPYANQSIAKKSKRGAANYDDGNIEGEIEQSDDDDDDGDITKDSMIKIKKKSDIKGKPETGKRKMKTETTGKKKMKK